MVKSISIDSFALHNVMCTDSIKLKFDETKADRSGEVMQEKNCYTNPHNIVHVSHWLL